MYLSESYYALRIRRGSTIYSKRQHFNPINSNKSAVVRLEHHGSSAKGEERSGNDHLGGPSDNRNRGLGVANSGSATTARSRRGGVTASRARMATIAVRDIFNLVEVGASQAGGVGIVDDKRSVAKEGRVARLE